MSKAKRFVYVIRTVRHPPRYYIGLTGDVAAGLADHNAGHSPHTAKGRPWRLHGPTPFSPLWGRRAGDEGF